MPTVTVFVGDRTWQTDAVQGAILGSVLADLDLPIEQPCAGRGTCGKCKILSEGGLVPPDHIERRHLSKGELAMGTRLACRALIAGDTQVVLAPIGISSNKIVLSQSRYKRLPDVPLGLAIDLGSTTVAALLVMLNTGEVWAGGASLNQQAVCGADLISRLAAAMQDGAAARRLHRLAVSSIHQAIESLQLSPRVRNRIERVVIVGNPAMHHLLANLPVSGLALTPFRPYASGTIDNAAELLDGIVPQGVRVSLPPLIGGFVGSDALACLAHFRFDEAPGPMAAIDLGTNGEIMATDGNRIVVASAAAGPAFEGVNIACGSRAVEGAITRVTIAGNELQVQTIGAGPPMGLSGSGLLSAVWALRQAGAIAADGRFNPDSPFVQPAPNTHPRGGRRIVLTSKGDIWLSQLDIRELQKAKGAIRVGFEIVLNALGLQAGDLERVILTGSFGGQVEVQAALGLGMIPPVRPEIVVAIANGAGLGAASFLTDLGLTRADRLARRVEHLDLQADTRFMERFISAMALK
jgi:uncharacterized 2Fe-2S/4Fe-4S cluster protein (DUF4445 family)